MKTGTSDTDSTLEDLQAVSQHVLTATERIHALEQEKRGTPPGSERFQELSNLIEALAAEMRLVSAAETSLAVELQGEPDLPTVEEADTRS
jgi:hypothetical protein